MAGVGELGSEVLVDMRGVAGTGEQDQRRAAASPIDDLKLHRIAYIHKTEAGCVAYATAAFRSTVRIRACISGKY